MLDFDAHNIDWHWFELELEAGDYHFGWVYKVYNYDNDKLAQDLYAAISNLQISGTEVFNTECTICRRGWANPGAESCNECLDGQYQEMTYENDQTIDITDEQVCHECGTDKYVFPGAVGSRFCEEKQTCDEADYDLSYGMCKNGKRKVTYKLMSPSKCILTSGTDEYESTVGCEECPEGSHEKVISGGYTKCEYCQTGFVHSKGKCVPCPIGSEAQKVFHMNADMFELPDFMKTWCSSSNPGIDMCHFSKGWVLENGILHTGENSDFLIEQILKIEFEVDYRETASIQLQLEGELFGS